eukprot:Gb_20486 [translate_table: standard]
MSLKDLKNTLKACPSRLSSYSSISLSSQLQPEEHHQQEQRKPPKSSVKQQLAGLEQLTSDLHTRTNQSTLPNNDQTMEDVQGTKRMSKKRSTFSGRDDTLPTENDEVNGKPEEALKSLKDQQLEEDEFLNGVGDSEAGLFVQPHTEGPFEPLVLSSSQGQSDNAQIFQVSCPRCCVLCLCNFGEAYSHEKLSTMNNTTCKLVLQAPQASFVEPMSYSNKCMIDDSQQASQEHHCCHGAILILSAKESTPDMQVSYHCMCTTSNRLNWFCFRNFAPTWRLNSYKCSSKATICFFGLPTFVQVIFKSQILKRMMQMVLLALFILLDVVECPSSSPFDVGLVNNVNHLFVSPCLSPSIRGRSASVQLKETSNKSTFPGSRVASLGLKGTSAGTSGMSPTRLHVVLMMDVPSLWIVADVLLGGLCVS